MPPYLILLVAWLVFPLLAFGSEPKEIIFWESTTIDGVLRPLQHNLQRQAIDVLLLLKKYDLILTQKTPKTLDPKLKSRILRTYVGLNIKKDTLQINIRAQLVNPLSGRVDRSVIRNSAFDDLLVDYRLAIYDLLLGKQQSQITKSELLKKTKERINELVDDGAYARLRQELKSQGLITGADNLLNKENNSDKASERNAESRELGVDLKSSNIQGTNQETDSSKYLDKNQDPDARRAEDLSAISKSFDSQESHDQNSDVDTAGVDSFENEFISGESGANQNFRFGLGYGNYFASAIGIIPVDTQLNLLTLHLGYLSELKSNRRHLQYFIAFDFQRATNGGANDIRSFYKLHTGFQRLNLLGPFFVGVCLQQENLAFGYLKGLGQGIFVNKSHLLWPVIRIGYPFIFLMRQGEVALGAGRSFYSNASNDALGVPLKPVGNKVSAEISGQIFGAYFFGLSYNKDWLKAGVGAATNHVAISRVMGRMEHKF